MSKLFAIIRSSLMRGGAVWQLVGLITRRSQVQILPPLPTFPFCPSCFFTSSNFWCYRGAVACPLLVCCLALLGGCSFTPSQSEEYSSFALSTSLKQKLDQHYHEWQGVVYRLGGVSKKGIDCSAFVREAFRSKLGVELPRTAVLQSRRGVSVKRHALQRGDLVFFKTGRRTRHVGIYLEAGRFLHASVSQGVTISALDNPYWRDRYWQARRIIGVTQ